MCIYVWFSKISGRFGKLNDFVGHSWFGFHFLPLSADLEHTEPDAQRILLWDCRRIDLHGWHISDQHCLFCTLHHRSIQGRFCAIHSLAKNSGEKDSELQEQTGPIFLWLVSVLMLISLQTVVIVYSSVVHDQAHVTNVGSRLEIVVYFAQLVLNVSVLFQSSFQFDMQTLQVFTTEITKAQI